MAEKKITPKAASAKKETSASKEAATRVTKRRAKRRAKRA
jgi:hypothetical protein